MFKATFLGWQGWLIESETTRLLADPLLLDEIGRGPRPTRLTFPFWPPRQLRPEALPAIDAVWISHEHEDHFNVPTLARIDRRVPLYVSARMSLAAPTIAEELGFSVTRIDPGDAVDVGDLTLTTFSPDHLSNDLADEWDTVAYLVADRDRQGAFFTNVDVAVTAHMVEAVARLASGDPPIQVLSYEGMKLGLWDEGRTRPQKASQMHHVPRTMGTCSADQALAALRDGEAFRPRSGQVFVSRNGQIATVLESARFLGVREEPWPEPEPFWPDPGTPMAKPRSGVQRFSDGDVAELEDGLGELARYLYRGPLFKQLYSLPSADLGRRLPTFALVLLAGDDKMYAYEYQPRACDFAALDEVEELSARYAGVVLLWATDLLALLRGEIEPRTITGSSSEAWIPECTERLYSELWSFFHPLRHPERTLDQYRRIAREETDAPCWVRAAGHAVVEKAATPGDGAHGQS
jgi:hypothetical protein